MIRTRVVEDWSRGRVRVLVMDDETRMVFGPNRVFTPEDDDMPPANRELPDEAFMVDLPYQQAQLVTDALQEHFAGQKAPGDAYALRRDLDHEKTRVDKLLDFAIEAARAPRTPER
jgi:hypothetical protein